MVKRNIDKIIKDAESIGVLNKTAARNIAIRERYKKMRAEFVKYDDAIIQLSKDYFLSISSIKSIILEKSKIKY